jgi:hypothetical protein
LWGGAIGGLLGFAGKVCPFCYYAVTVATEIYNPIFGYSV